MEFGDQPFFDLVKRHINPQHYVECGLCGAIEVEGRELVQMLSHSVDDELTDLILTCLDKLLEPPPADFGRLSYDDWLKWEAVNAHRLFIDDDYDEGTCIKYDKVVLYYDTVCDCFHKEKIRDSV
jgi:hypothetical protein